MISPEPPQIKIDARGNIEWRADIGVPPEEFFMGLQRCLPHRLFRLFSAFLWNAFKCPKNNSPVSGTSSKSQQIGFNTLLNNSAAPRPQNISKHSGGMRLQGIRCAPPLRAVKTPKNLFSHNGLPARDVPYHRIPGEGCRGNHFPCPPEAHTQNFLYRPSSVSCFSLRLCLATMVERAKSPSGRPARNREGFRRNSLPYRVREPAWERNRAVLARVTAT